MYAKEPTHRSESWRRAVASLRCVRCMREGNTQAAHANHRGKGLALKAPDCWTVPLCMDCHREFDQGRELTKVQKRELMDEWLILTIRELASRGLVKA